MLLTIGVQIQMDLNSCSGVNVARAGETPFGQPQKKLVGQGCCMAVQGCD